MEGDPFAMVEVDDHRRVRDRMRARVSLHPRRVPAGVRAHAAAVDRGATSPAARPGILGATVLRHRDPPRRAARTSAAKRRRIFESIEGRRGEPRNKPPFPGAAPGCSASRRVVNNVETLANIPRIVLRRRRGVCGRRHGAIRQARACSACRGHVQYPGRLRGAARHHARCVIEMAGGLRRAGRCGRCCSAAQPARSCGRTSSTSQLTHEDTRAAGTTLGSGVVMVVDDTVDIRDLVLRIAAFFRDESCGQCVPCRVGTVRQEEALHRIARARTRGGARDRSSRCSTKSASR